MRLQKIFNAVPNFLPKLKLEPERKNVNLTMKKLMKPLTEENKFKVHFFNYILDITLNSLNERFTLLETHNKNVQFLYDILKLKDINDKNTRILLYQSSVNTFGRK
jgi:hypothetical protein